MNPLKHDVCFWENASQKNPVPCCEPSKSFRQDLMHQTDSIQYGDGVNYNCVSVKRRIEIPDNARKCRKLLKKSWEWHLKKDFIKTHSDELDDFFYHCIICKDILIKLPEARFYFKRRKNWCILARSCYVSDDHGIALLKFSYGRLRCCYLDFKRLSTLHLNVKLPDRTYGVKLYRNVLWLICYDNSSSLSVTYIRMTNEKNLCGITLKGLPMTYTCIVKMVEEMIAVNTDTLMPFITRYYVKLDSKTSKLVIKHYDIPDGASKVKIYLLGTRLVLHEEEKSEGAPVIYLGITEPEIKLTQKIDLASSLHHSEQYISFGVQISVHERGMKMLILSENSYIVVVDILKGCITQILSFVQCFWQHKLSLYFSTDGEWIRLIGESKEMRRPEWSELLCVNFPVWHGFSLKEMCQRVVVKMFSCSKLQHLNLPKSIVQDLQNLHINAHNKLDFHQV